MTFAQLPLWVIHAVGFLYLAVSTGAMTCIVRAIGKTHTARYVFLNLPVLCGKGYKVFRHLVPVTEVKEKGDTRIYDKKNSGSDTCPDIYEIHRNGKYADNKRHPYRPHDVCPDLSFESDVAAHILSIIPQKTKKENADCMCRHFPEIA